MSDRVAFIDTGTNSIHILIIDFSDSWEGNVIYSEKATVRMGKSLYENGFLDNNILEVIREVLMKFSRVSRMYSVREIVAKATSAAREAPNGDELVKVAESCGIPLEVISGKEEARLTRLGVAGPFCMERTLCIDIGGGSTEIALAHEGEDVYLDSLRLGAIRMAFGSGIDQQGPVSDEEYLSLKRKVLSECSAAAEAVHAYGFDRVMGSSGTVEVTAEACAALRGDGDASYLLRSELSSAMKLMCSMTAEERLAVPKISKKRAEIVIGGGVVLEGLMEAFGIERIDVSPTGLREGMKVDYISKSSSKVSD